MILPEIKWEIEAVNKCKSDRIKYYIYDIYIYKDRNSERARDKYWYIVVSKQQKDKFKHLGPRKLN